MNVSVSRTAKAVGVGSVILATTLPAHAAFDYSGLTTAITEEVTAGTAFAAAALAVVMGAMVGLKLAKKFFSRAT